MNNLKRGNWGKCDNGKVEGKGYIYFVYSKIVNMIYVGSTTTKNRIFIYESILNKEEGPGKISSYNFYTKRNTISYELAGDLFNSRNDFKVKYYMVDNHKNLEKTYIRYLNENNFDLYNKILYKNHKYNLNDIDKGVIDILLETKK
jgi:hypothetical protein